MPASSVPGYVCGYRFNQSNYSLGKFTDLSGYGAPLVVKNGLPSFGTFSGREGVSLDNTWNGSFFHPNSWQGTVVFVSRMEHFSSGTLFRYPINFNLSEGATTSGRLSSVFFGAERRIRLQSAGNITPGDVSGSDGEIIIAAFAHDQIRRISYRTSDGVNVVSTPADTGTVHGLPQSMRAGLEEGNGAIFGATLGNSGNITFDTAVAIHAFELHFFEGNAIIDAAAELAAFIVELQSYYSI